MGSRGRFSRLGGANTPTTWSSSLSARASSTDFPNADWPMMTIFISIPAAGLAVSLVETPSEMLFDGYF
jgi:hypothetical protein